MHPADLDLGAVAGAIGAWTPGGAIKTSGSSHVLTAEDSDGYVWCWIPFRGKANNRVTVTVTGQLSTTSNWTDLPTFAIVDPLQPWRGASELLDSEVMVSNTDSQAFTLNYTPTCDKELAFLVRARGGNAGGSGTGTCTFSYAISPAGATVAHAAIG